GGAPRAPTEPENERDCRGRRGRDRPHGRRSSNSSAPRADRLCCLSMKDIVIVEAVRSAVGRAHKGSLALKRPDEMAGEVIRGLLARVPQVKPADVEDVVLGCAMPEGEQGLNVARVVQLLGGLPIETSAQT